MPIGVPPSDVAAARTEIGRLAREAGRDPSKITITVMMGAPPGMEEAALEMLPPRDILAAYRDAGADRVVVSIPTLDSAGTLAHLDRLASAKP
jgi:hypothetical protein